MVKVVLIYFVFLCTYVLMLWFKNPLVSFHCIKSLTLSIKLPLIVLILPYFILTFYIFYFLFFFIFFYSYKCPYLSVNDQLKLNPSLLILGLYPHYLLPIHLYHFSTQYLRTKGQCAGDVNG